MSNDDDELYTPSEVKARNVIVFGAITEGNSLTPREAGNIVIELAKQIEKERPKNGNKTR
jgi:hypothetical protein